LDGLVGFVWCVVAGESEFCFRALSCGRRVHRGRPTRDETYESLTIVVRRLQISVFTAVKYAGLQRDTNLEATGKRKKGYVLAHASFRIRQSQALHCWDGVLPSTFCRCLGPATTASFCWYVAGQNKKLFPLAELWPQALANHGAVEEADSTHNLGRGQAKVPGSTSLFTLRQSNHIISRLVLYSK
jgi:hypothetical protein